MSKSTKFVASHESVELVEFGHEFKVEGVVVKVNGFMLILDGIPDLIRVEVVWPTSSDPYAKRYYDQPMAALTTELMGMGMKVQAKVNDGGLTFEAQMPEEVAAQLQIVRLRCQRNELQHEAQQLAQAGLLACTVGEGLNYENHQLRQEMQDLAQLLKLAGMMGAAQEQELHETQLALTSASIKNVVLQMAISAIVKANQRISGDLAQSEADLRVVTQVANQQAAELRKAHNFKQAVKAAVADHSGQPEVSDEMPILLPIGDGTVNVDCGDCVSAANCAGHCLAKAA